MVDNNDAVIHKAQAISSAALENLEIYKDDPNSSCGSLAAGKISEIEADLSDAIEWYSKAVAQDKDNHEAKARLALALLKRGDIKDGAEAAVSLAAEAPNYNFDSLIMKTKLSSMTVLGDAMRGSDRQEAAESAYRKALELRNEDSHSAGWLGVILLQQNRLEEATKALAHVNPDCGTFGPIQAAAELAAADPDLFPAIFDTHLDLTTVPHSHA